MAVGSLNNNTAGVIAIASLNLQLVVPVNDCRVVIWQGNLLQVFLKSTSAFFQISPSADPVIIFAID